MPVSFNEGESFPIHNKIQEQLETEVNNWLAMPLPGAEEKKSDAFYWEKVFPLSRELFIAKEGLKLQEKPFNGLILTVGTSPEPLILSISVCEPERVVFLYSPDTESYIDDIVEITGLKPSKYDKYQVSETDPLDIYRSVVEAWEKWKVSIKFAVDITGGTKSMTGGLAMVGALLGLPIVYVSGSYIPNRRRPKPGSETINLLPNPYQVYGALKEREAIELFRRMNYQGASKIYTDLAESVPEPQKFIFLSILTKAYQHWDALDFSPAADCLSEAATLVSQYRLISCGSKTDDLTELSKRLRNLYSVMPSKSGDNSFSLLQDFCAFETLLFTVYHSSKRRATVGMWDTASLLLYRLLEIMAQRRLANYGIDTADPDYSCFDQQHLACLLNKLNQLRKDLKMFELKELPAPISLMDGYMLLQALKDAYSLENTLQSDVKIHWGKFLNEIKKRNYSILAHGFVFVSDQQHSEFLKLVEALFQLFCKVEGYDQPKMIEFYEFATPETI